MKTETPKEYHEFLETLVIEEIKKELNIKGLKFTHKKEFGGSKLWTYYFKDEFGFEWSYDVPYRAFNSIANRNPKIRARIVVLKWAVITSYLESKYTGDGKWHQHTTKWYDNSSDAWKEKEKWEIQHSKQIDASSSSLIHKDI